MTSYEEINIGQVESETDPFTEERYGQFYKFLKKNTVSVLDIGCNTGRGGAVLKKINSELKVSGLDAVKARLDRLPSDVYENRIYGLSTSIPCDDASFDAVVAGEFIEHLYANDVQKTISEVFRVLKIGGRFVLTTPNPRDVKKKLRNESVLGGSHVSQHFHDVLRIQLMMNGFSNVRVYGSGKVSRYLWMRFPFLNIFGSYLLVADKF